MKNLLARRMTKIKRSFIREIMKAGDDPDIISFAGGLPNPLFFPVEAIAAATAKVLANDGPQVLQYSASEGYYPLREFIANRYAKQYGLDVAPENILITNGSQQGLDLIGKIFLDQGDRVIIEQPGYLGAIQCFSIFEPELKSVPLLADGIDLAALETAFQTHSPKLFYAVPNFQNPSGLTYSREKRQAVADLSQQYGVCFIEDNPYGDLRFTGEDLPPLWRYAPDSVVMLGSFSKIASPGIRMGWLCAPPEVMEHLVTVKQAADLHSNQFSQRVIYQYLLDNDLEAHIQTIRLAYKAQRNLMIEMIDECFPPEVHYTEPEGGMFLWLTLPAGMSALDLFNQAIQANVSFVPGEAFHLDGEGANTLRLNFSNANAAKIEEGMQRLSEAVKLML